MNYWAVLLPTGLPTSCGVAAVSLWTAIPTVLTSHPESPSLWTSCKVTDKNKRVSQRIAVL